MGRKTIRSDVSARFVSVSQVLIEKYDIVNERGFCSSIGIQQQIFSDIKSGKLQAGTDLISVLLIKYDAVNPEWILTGKGEMLKSSPDDENIINEDTSGYSMANTLLEQLSKLTDTVLSQQKTIESLIETNKKAVVHLADNATNADVQGA